MHRLVLKTIDSVEDFVTVAVAVSIYDHCSGCHRGVRLSLESIRATMGDAWGSATLV